MKNNKDSRTLEERAADLEKVITFNIVNSVRRNYKSVEDFRRVYSAIVNGTAGGAEQVKFCGLFGFKRENQRRILGYETVDGKMRYISLKDVQPYFSRWFHYQRHFNRNYRSGRTFSVRGYFYIDFDVLERMCGRDDVIDANSDFYSRRQHVMIDALVFNSFVKDDGVMMTKAQEKQYVREYEQGRRKLTLQQYKLDEADKRRRADKRRVTMAKKESEDAPGEIVQKNVRAALSGNGATKPPKDSDSGVGDEFRREEEMKSEISPDWNYYPHEGPKTR